MGGAPTVEECCTERNGLGFVVDGEKLCFPCIGKCVSTVTFTMQFSTCGHILEVHLQAMKIRPTNW